MADKTDVNPIVPKFLAVYQQVQNPSKDGKNDHFKSKYATLETVIEGIKPLLAEHDLALVQENISDEYGVGVATYLMDEKGNRLDLGAFTVPLAKRDPQGAGSAITYCRRYALKSIFGLVEVDDDGNDGSTRAAEEQKAREAEKQRATLDSYLEALIELAKTKDGGGDMLRTGLKLGAKAQMAQYRTAYAALTDTERKAVEATIAMLKEKS